MDDYGLQAHVTGRMALLYCGHGKTPTSKGDRMHMHALKCFLAFAAAISTSAVAQTTVGEVLDAGGKKLTKEEVVTLVAGANVSGPTTGGGQFQSDYKADGTLTGTMQTTNMKGGARFGKWTVEDTGMLCTEITTTIVKSSGAREDKTCAYWFRLSDKYFVALDSDARETHVLERTVKR